ncbi:MAG: hypothetical protein ABIT09_06460 [Croceibacterium sp.]
MKLPDHLPPLTGRGLAIYRAVWAVMFVLALIGASFGAAMSARDTRASNTVLYSLGLRVSATNGLRRIGPLLTFTAQAGLRRDSTIVAIDGRAWPVRYSYSESRRLERALGGTEGTVHRLELRDGSGREYTVSLPVRRANLAAFDSQSALPLETRLAFYIAASVLTSCLMIAAATVLFARRVREPVAALLSLGMLAVVASGAAILTGISEFIDLMGKIDPGSLLIGTALLLFPSGRFDPRWTWAVLPPLLLSTTTPPGLTDAVGTGLLLGVIAAILLANRIRYRRMATAVERQQVKWATLGIALALLILALTSMINLYQPRVTDPVFSVALSLTGRLLALLSTLCLVGGLLISLLRYRLYDAETALSRSALYGGLALAMIAVFAGTEKLVEILAEQYFGESVGAASGAIAAGVAAAIIPLFHRRLERWAERRFQGPLLTLRDKLPSDLGDWRETAELPELANDALARVMAALRSHGGAIVVPDARDPVLAARALDPGQLTTWLSAHDPAATELDREDRLLPLRIGLGQLPDQGPVYLLLGTRPDGTMPGKDERDAARAVADPLARALSVTVRRMARDHALHTTLSDLGARLARLETRPA